MWNWLAALFIHSGSVSETFGLMAFAWSSGFVVASARASARDSVGIGTNPRTGDLLRRRTGDLLRRRMGDQLRRRRGERRRKVTGMAPLSRAGGDLQSKRLRLEF